MPHYEGVVKVRCRATEGASEALDRLLGPNPPRRFWCGFWAEEPPAGERLVAAVSVRPGDPDLPVFDRRPDLPLPEGLQPPVLVVARYAVFSQPLGIFALLEPTGEVWAVQLANVYDPCPSHLPLMLGEVVSQTAVKAGPFQSVTRALRWLRNGTADAVTLRPERE